jgi:undecaprenyl-diphosphatase
MVLASVGYLIMARKRAAALVVLGAVLGGQLLCSGLKNIFERARPDPIPDAPTVFTAQLPERPCHALSGDVSDLGALLARVDARRGLRIYALSLAVSLTVAIGVTRVFLGVHWPTDVLAGWCVGAAWATLCWFIALSPQRRGQVEQPSKA